jgi:hypothetical protein
MTAQERQLLAEQFQALAEERRAHAMKLAELARNGAVFPPDTAPKIRSALAEEINHWRDEFQVGRREWQAMRDQWLAERGTMSPQDWALRRAAWFEARDTWIANQRQFASSGQR